MSEPPRLSWRLRSLRGWSHDTSDAMPARVARAVRLVREHRDEHPSEWAAIRSVAGKLGMSSEALRKWPRQEAVDQGRRPGVTSEERERIRELEREDRELRRADEILNAAYCPL